GGPPAAWQGPDLKISKTEFRNTFHGVQFHWFGKLQNECCTTAKDIAYISSRLPNFWRHK
ncbi:hypothetical protein, partial [Rhodoferax ferrireducens]|uniref:hypothetical protein n=1 Tax=Rhodoferax ferrireducens TaxID=192843 RepID=UPI003BB71715